MLKKRLAQNFGANWFAQFTNVLVQLASVPLFLTFWSLQICVTHIRIDRIDFPAPLTTLMDRTLTI